MGFSIEHYKNMKANKEHTVEEVVEALRLMRDSTETNLNNMELFDFKPDSEVLLQVKYEAFAIALALVESIKK